MLFFLWKYKPNIFIGQCFSTLHSENIENCPTPGSAPYDALCNKDQSKSPHEKGEDEDYPTDSHDDIERLCKIKGHCKNGQCILDENGQTACLCDEGYEPDRLELICNDVDECQDGSARNDFPL